MAAISQKALPAEVMPMVARRVYQDGYQVRTPTEFLLLLQRYVVQARRLQALAGPASVIRVDKCTEAGPLLDILGYRLVHDCGSPDAKLQAANGERAFLTVDSGFPITDLEEALQHDTAFVYPYRSTPVPVLLQESDWVTLSAGQTARFNNLLDIVLGDPAVARLYWALSETDADTSQFMARSVGLRPLLPITSLLDFYGSQLSIRGGRVLVPGGAKAEAGWKALVGANPDSAANFVMHLYTKDDGWLAAYFDALSRVDAVQQEHLTQNPRLKKYYEAFRTSDRKDQAGGSSFRKAASLLLLDTRIRWEADGQPHVPGGVAVWNSVLEQRSDLKNVRDWGKHHKLSQPDELIEAMVASAREDAETGPLQLYLTLSELDRKRGPAAQVSPETVRFLAAKYSPFNYWYPVFAEFPMLSDDSITRFITTAENLEKIRSSTLRANALGAFQANVGLWQILARQKEIPTAELNTSWQAALQPFANIQVATQLFDSTCQSLRTLLRAAGAPADSSPSQIIDLLAGPAQQTPEGQRVHAKLVAKIGSVLEDQQLVSLDTLFALGDGLQKMAQGGKAGDDMMGMATELRGFELPRPIFTKSEKISFAPGIYTSRHTELQVQTDLTKVLKAPATKAQLESARGELAAFLRDTLVGLNYAYYEPPGAQIMHINPLFVRAHDFLRVSVIGAPRVWQVPEVVGAGISAGGGAYLMGSLVDLPFSLATAEQDFIVPENVQALIWKEVVPDLVAASTLPRWWDVSPEAMHAVALYQRSGEEILHAAAKNNAMRAKTLEILSMVVAPHRLEEFEDALASTQALSAFMPRVMPVETAYLAEKYRSTAGDEAQTAGAASKELAELLLRAPDGAYERVAARFGVPHPILACDNAPEILNLRPFPMSGGYTNRMFGESLESVNLYWARVADEQGYSPAMLHLLVPELTRVMIGKVFASDMEDWPAVMRAMREAGEDLQQGKIASLRKNTESVSADVVPGVAGARQTE